MKFLVVGAGLAGASCARVLHDAGHEVTVIDSSAHVAGNCYDEPSPYVWHIQDMQPVYIQLYGPHIFHTNSKQVFDFLSRFTAWNTYNHRVVVDLDGSGDKMFPMTPNREGIINDLMVKFFGFPPEHAAEMHKELDALIVELGRPDPSILELQKSTSSFGNLLASILWTKVYAPYTLRQWGTSTVDASILERVRIDLSDTKEDATYFKDRYQYQPLRGFTRMVQSMLDGIEVKLNTPFRLPMVGQYDHVFFTGAVDDLLIQEGSLKSLEPLPYRTMQFNFLHKRAGEEVYPSHHFRHTHRAATVNFPRSYYQSAVEAADGIVEKPPLRITSFRRLSSEPGRIDHTKSDVYCLEYPTQWEPNTGMTRHYPIPGRENRDRYDSLVYDAGIIFGNRITFFGRLGSYQYLNMDQAVAQGISTANSYLATTKGA